MRKGKTKHTRKVGIVYSDIISVLHTSISCTLITNELAARHGLHIGSNGIISDGLPRMQGTISDQDHFVAPFVPAPGTEQPLIVLTGDFVAFLIPAPCIEKASILPTGGFAAPFVSAPGTETSLVLPTGIASNVELRQDNAHQGR